MPRPFTRVQAIENAAFLNALRRTGNAREAARRLGQHRAKFTRRRASHPAFAAEWDAALALAHAALEKPLSFSGGGAMGQCHKQTGARDPHLHKTPSGRLQLRSAGGRRRLTRAAEQSFLAALSATANVRLSAAAAGFSHSAFYARRRASPAFAREMRLALEMGYDRIEMALLESWSPEAHADDAWRHNDPPPIPPMTADEALRLLAIRQKEARLWSEPDYIKRRRGESSEAHSIRLSAMYEARLQRAREEFEVAEAARLARGEGPYWGEAKAPVVPDLAQVRWKPHAGSGAGRETATTRPAGGPQPDPSDDAGFTPASGVTEMPPDSS